MASEWYKLSDAEKIEALRAGMSFFAECFRGLATHFVSIAGELEKTYAQDAKAKAEDIAEMWRRFQKPDAAEAEGVDIEVPTVEFTIKTHDEPQPDIVERKS